MADIRTTLLWDVWDALLAFVQALDFPAIPEMDDQPPVVAFGADPDVTYEAIILPGVPPRGGSNQEWRTAGRARKDETFMLALDGWSAVPGRNDADARARARQLWNVIEAGIRDQTSGHPLGAPFLAVPGLRVWSLATLDAAVGPLSVGTEGFGASFHAEFEFKGSV